MRPVRAPGMPAREEIAKREIAHLQYREWCTHCVRCRGLS